MSIFPSAYAICGEFPTPQKCVIFCVILPVDVIVIFWRGFSVVVVIVVGAVVFVGVVVVGISVEAAIVVLGVVVVLTVVDVVVADEVGF